MEDKLKTGFWVAAYLRRLQLNDIPVFVTRRGDENAGAVLIKSNTLDGNAQVYHRSFDQSGAHAWMVLADGPEAEVDQSITRQCSFDPDIWVLEVEDKTGRTLLDEPGLNG